MSDARTHARTHARAHTHTHTCGLLHDGVVRVHLRNIAQAASQPTLPARIDLDMCVRVCTRVCRCMHACVWARV